MLAGEFVELENWRRTGNQRQDSDGPRWYDCLELPTRTINMIERENIRSLSEIESMTDQELLSKSTFGKKSLKDLRLAVQIRRREITQQL